MRIMAFSERTVMEAKTATDAGFDTVEKYETVNNDEKKSTHVCLANAGSRYEINEAHFPELKPGDNVSLDYIVHHEFINEFYASKGLAPKSDAKGVTA